MGAAQGLECRLDHSAVLFGEAAGRRDAEGAARPGPQREVTVRAREYSKSGGSNYVNKNSISGVSGSNEIDSKSWGDNNNNGSGCAINSCGAREKPALERAGSTAQFSG